MLSGVVVPFSRFSSVVVVSKKAGDVSAVTFSSQRRPVTSSSPSRLLSGVVGVVVCPSSLVFHGIAKAKRHLNEVPCDVNLEGEDISNNNDLSEDEITVENLYAEGEGVVDDVHTNDGSAIPVMDIRDFNIDNMEIILFEKGVGQRIDGGVQRG
ncbi:unnamed protein product [Linum tenue]|uniref:Uncharacterized protein n=1 Tax=Linum tenue TaxID=586396 RepID=A0AAV0MCV6_9ROSI|nr:unnamed protein product [Linum tenue]